LGDFSRWRSSGRLIVRRPHQFAEATPVPGDGRARRRVVGACQADNIDVLVEVLDAGTVRANSRWSPTRKRRKGNGSRTKQLLLAPRPEFAQPHSPNVDSAHQRLFGVWSNNYVQPAEPRSATGRRKMLRCVAGLDPRGQGRDQVGRGWALQSPEAPPRHGNQGRRPMLRMIDNYGLSSNPTKPGCKYFRRGWASRVRVFQQ